MNIVVTAIILLITLLVVPAFSYYFGTPLGELEVQALTTVAYIAIGIILLCFVLGEITGNVSQTDKLWSIAPIIYAWVVACYGEYSDRLLLMAVLVTLWGVRLSYNFSRHGGYQWKFWGGHEDYRWEVLRQRPEFQNRFVWGLFDLGFICGYQNTLVLLFTLPTIVALQNNDVPLSGFDYLIAVAMFACICYETVADNQHWRYQTEKYRRINAGESLAANGSEADKWGDYEKGFLDRGLWAGSRHPNYLAEQSIWVCFYLFSVSASGEWLNWSIAGMLLLIVMFRSSSDFSEEVSAEKYPQYAEFQKNVPRFLPLGFLK